MHNLFLALFGGLYYGFKYADDNSKIKTADREMEARRVSRENFKSLYGAETELEHATKEYIMCGRYFEDICNLLADDLEFALGENWKQDLDIPNGFRVNYGAFYPHQHVYWVYHLLLAKKGKMDRWSMSMGYRFASIYTKERDHRFLQSIEKNLIKNKVPAKIVYEDNDALSSYKPEIMCIRPYRRMW